MLESVVRHLHNAERSRSKAAPQARQHAEAEHIDLENAEIFEIVLVPFDHGALFHRGILDRHDFVEVRSRDDEAADMLGKMARKLHQLLRQRHDLLRRGSEGSSPARRASFSVTPAIDQPQSVLARAPIVSSDSPNTLPTSRMALRPR